MIGVADGVPAAAAALPVWEAGAVDAAADELGETAAEGLGESEATDTADGKVVEIAIMDGVAVAEFEADIATDNDGPGETAAEGLVEALADDEAEIVALGARVALMEGESGEQDVAPRPLKEPCAHGRQKAICGAGANELGGHRAHAVPPLALA